MNKAWKAIKQLHDSGAKHIKKRKKIKNFTFTQILAHAGEELVELASEQDDMEEMADVLTCLFHYAIKKGWSKSDIEKMMVKKLEESVPDLRVLEKLK